MRRETFIFLHISPRVKLLDKILLLPNTTFKAVSGEQARLLQGSLESREYYPEIIALEKHIMRYRKFRRSRKGTKEGKDKKNKIMVCGRRAYSE